MSRYQITGHLATYQTLTENGPMFVTAYRGAILPPDVSAKTIEHLLSVKLIVEIDDGLGGGTDATGAAVTSPSEEVTTSEPDGQDSDEDPATVEPDVDPELEAKREAARAELPKDGSLPSTAASKAVWVEYAVANGYDYATAATATKNDVIALFKQ